MTCARLLQERQVDVALIPTTAVLLGGDTLRILPEAAVSSWSYPYARIALSRGVEQIKSVACPEPSAQEALMARIILQEHYGRRPVFVARPEAELRHAADDGCLLIGPELPGDSTLGTMLDLGQEWYELAQYPMVWGLFVTLADAATPGIAKQVKAVVREAEVLAGAWPVDPSFYADSLRLRMDDVVIASLSRIREYLYYYKVTSELGELPIFMTEGRENNAPWWAAS